MSPSPLSSFLHRPKAVVIASLMLVVLGASTIPTTAEAQPDERRHGIFVDTIDVNLVNIEVTAVDEDGNPVTDLTRDEFVVTEDKEPVTVTNFFVVEDGVRRDAGEVMVLGGEAGENLTTTVPEEPTEPHFLVLFVDQQNLSPNHRQRVFTQLDSQLDRLLGPADRVLVVSQNRQVSVEQPFTRDRALIDAALDRISRQVGASAHQVDVLRLQNELQQGGGPGLTSDDPSASPSTRQGFESPGITPADEARSLMASIQSLTGQLVNDSRQTLAALNRFVSSMAGLPGRKAILYVSDGFELRPGEFLFRLWEDKYRLVAGQAGVTSVDFEMDRLDLREPFGQLLASAGANRVAFYTVEGGNTRLDGAGTSAEVRTSVASSTARFADGGRRQSLERLAVETGGVALVGGGNVRLLVDRLEQDLGHYYSLGYESPNRGDGRYHRIQVTVTRPGVEVRYLEGYRDKTADERMTDQTLASLLFDVGENPLDVEVELGEETREEKNRFTVPVLIKVPLSKLVLIPQGEAHQGRISIFVAVRDEVGRMSDPQKIEVPVEIPNEQLLTAMTQTAAYATRLAMRGGSQKIAIGVKDELAAVDSTLNLNVDVGQ